MLRVKPDYRALIKEHPMKTRLVSVLILAAGLTLFSLISLSQAGISVALAHNSPQKPLLKYHNHTPAALSPILWAKNDISAVARLVTNTNVTTYYVFLPIVFHQPAPDFVTRLVNETNVYRIQHGCPALTLSQQLSSAAEGHSEDMALNDFCSHVGSDGSSLGQRIAATGYEYWSAAENIAAGYATPEAVVQAWMTSDSHRANILNCNLLEIGVGYYYLANDTGSENYHHYWTQVLALPQ